MPLIEPFRGIRYEPLKVGSLSAVCAPPYDVIDGPEKRRLLGLSPYNSVRLILPDDEPDRDRFAAAAGLLERWLAEGILAAEDHPAVYPYTMSYVHPGRGPTVTRGIVAAVGLDDRYSIVPHEKTLPNPLGEQMRLIEKTRANLSPIYLLALPRDGSSGAITDIASGDWPLLGQCEEPSGVKHSLSRIDDLGVVKELQDRLENSALIIADGHHRYEVARSYHKRSHSPGSDRIMAYVVDLDEASHSVESTHRVVLPDAGITGAELERRFGEAFDGLEEVPAEAPSLYALLEENRVVLVLPSRRESRPNGPRRAYATGPLPRHGDPGSSLLLPASIVHDSILDGIPPADIVFEPSPEPALAAISRGDAAAALLLPPPPLAAVTDAARSGRLLPQKSTYFYPKPRTGAVFRLLDR